MPHTIAVPESPRLASARDTGTRTVRVALAGCGVVGGELLRLLRDRSSAIERTHALRYHVVRVLVRDTRRPRPAALPADLLTTDVDSFLATDADLVVEAIGGLEPAGRIARHALARRRGFITANKALVAAHGEELAALARQGGAPLSYEAAVAGGVPVIRVLRESLPQAGVQAIRGILNGTTNFILTRMSRGVPFAVALSEAQANGFAEADPTRDLNGQDAADKIAILAWQAFGTLPERLRVHRTGLLPDPDRIVGDAAALGGTAKLVAECVRLPTGVAASVEPVVVARDSAFARASAEENLIEIDTDSSGTIRLSGPGAGGGPTASAILSDMLRAAPAPAPAQGGSDGLVSAPDTRPHRWAVSVRGSARERAALLRAADRARVGVTEAGEERGSGITRVLTTPLTRARAGLLARALEAAGLRPVVLRFEAEP